MSEVIEKSSDPGPTRGTMLMDTRHTAGMIAGLFRMLLALERWYWRSGSGDRGCGLVIEFWRGIA
jgi:hypothetical protein